MEHLNGGEPVQGGSDVHQFMHKASQEALRLTSEINSRYHEPEQLPCLFSQLIGQPVDESFGLFPPFYTDCGKNIHIGKRVWIGANATVLPGVTVGDGAVIGLQGWIDCFAKTRLAGTIFAGGVTSLGDIQGHRGLEQAILWVNRCKEEPHHAS